MTEAPLGPGGTYGLYGGKAPHQKTDTSEAAADAIMPHVGRLQRQVLDVLQGSAERGLIGATDHETVEATGIALSSVNARRNELVGYGLVVDSGMRRRTKSRRNAIVWALAPKPIEPDHDKGTGDATPPPPDPIPSVIAQALVDLRDMKMFAITDLRYRIKHPEETITVMRWLARKANEEVEDEEE